MLIIEHDMDIALQVARHVTVLHYGRVIADGTREEIRDNPLVGGEKTTLIRSVIGFMPLRRGRVRFKGEDITRAPAFRAVARGLGLVP